MLGLRKLLFGANTMQQNSDGAVTPINAPVPVPVAEMPAVTRFLGRQPILDAGLNLYGYELLFRAGTTNSYAGDARVDQEEATRLVIDNCLSLIPEAGQGVTFVNCTRDALVSGLVTLLPAATTVLEILEDVEPDDELLDACRKLKKAGYRFALDDFSPDGFSLPFLEVASYVKVDFRASDAATRRRIYKMVDGSNARLIAEKVQTLSDIDAAREEGCEFFQGYFFSKPLIVSSRLIPQSHLTYLQLIAELAVTPSNLDKIERLVMSEPALCYRLLRLVNSALYGLRTPVSTVRSALMVVGDDEVRKLVTVGMASVFQDGHSKSLVSVALERARFCELLAPLLQEPAGKLYLLGMLSMFDALLQKPMTQIMDMLPIPDDMKTVLLGRQNSLSVVLNLIRCNESGDWHGCEEIREALGLTATKALTIYTQSVHWAERMLHHANEVEGISLAS
jgi:EAL and modified HD-GYP domain-containing signal transduction protein